MNEMQPAPGDNRQVLPTQKEGDYDLLCWLRSIIDRETWLQAKSRAQMALDADYFDDRQYMGLSEEEVKELEDRGQSFLQFNEIKPAILWITGAEKRSRFNWRIAPRSEDDVEPAIRKTKLIRYIEDVNNAQWKRSAAFEQMVKVGCGWTEVAYRPDPFSGDWRVCIEDVHWREIIRDSTSRRSDMSDARYVIRTRIVDKEEATAWFPEKGAMIEAECQERDDLEQEVQNEAYMVAGTSVGASGALSLNRMRYGDGRMAVRLWEVWYRKTTRVKVLRGEGALVGAVFNPQDPRHIQAVQMGMVEPVDSIRSQMHVAIITRNHILHSGLSPYQHNRFPYVPRIAFIDDRDGDAYGVIRSMRDPQDDLNKRRNKALFMLSTRRVIADDDAVEKWNELEEEVSRPDSIIKVKRGSKLEVQDNVQLAASHVEFGMQDSAYIRQVSGVTGENLGLQTNATSGIAIQARQEQGTIITTNLFESNSLAMQLEGELALSLCEQFYTEPMQFRITGERGRPEFVSVNSGDPETDITRSKSDFIVDRQDYRTTVRASLAEQLLQVAGQVAQHTGNPMMGMAMVEMAVDLTDLPNKAEILAQMRRVSGTPDPDEPPEQRQQREQQQQQEQQRQAEMTNRKILAEISKLEADAAKAHAGADAQAAQAIRDKMQALQDAMSSAGLVSTNPNLAGIVDDLLSNINRILSPTGAMQ